MPRFHVIIPAAGSGSRMGAQAPKQYLRLNGKSLIQHVIKVFDQATKINSIHIVLSEGDTHWRSTYLNLSNKAQVHHCGGETRAMSVLNGLHAIASQADEDDWILVHDAARPLVPIEVIQSVVAAVRSGAKAVIPVLPLVDTIKRVNNQGIAIETVDRNQLRRVQTPQGFDRVTLDLAYSNPEVVATDDAGLMDALGIPVQTVAGDERALKITTMSDVQHALSLLEATSE